MQWTKLMGWQVCYVTNQFCHKYIYFCKTPGLLCKNPGLLCNKPGFWQNIYFVTNPAFWSDKNFTAYIYIYIYIYIYYIYLQISVRVVFKILKFYLPVTWLEITWDFKAYWHTNYIIQHSGIKILLLTVTLTFYQYS